MSSYVQVIIGGILLVTAFLFGRHINNKPVLPTTQKIDVENSETDSQSLIRQKPVSDVVKSEDVSSNALQKSLRERILGDREKNRQPPKKEKLAANDPGSPFLLPDQEIVVPDFSNLGSSSEIASSQTSQRSLQPETPSEKLPRKSDSENRRRFDGVVVGPIPHNLPRKDFNRLPKKTDKVSVLSKPKPITKRGKIKIGKPSDYLVPVRRESKKESKVEKFVNYKTVFGDTLHGLSNHFFGKPDYYMEIYLANRDRMQNPSSVPVNTTLRIPLVAELIRE